MDVMTVRVDQWGPVLLPAAVRERFGWRPGSTLSLRVDDNGVRLVDRAAILAGIRELMAPADYSLEQFLADKRREAQAEEAEIQAWLDTTG